MKDQRFERLIRKVSSINLDHVGFQFSSVGKTSAGYKNFITLVHFKSPFRNMTLYFQVCASLENESDPIEAARGYSLNVGIKKTGEYHMNFGTYAVKHELPLAKLNNGTVVGDERHIDNYIQEFETASRTYLFDFLMGTAYEETPDPRDY